MLRFYDLPAYVDFARAGDLAGALEGVDLVFLEQEVDALHVAVDAFLLEGKHLLQIELRLRDADAHARKIVTRFLEEMRSVQERL